jgi:hypothetical protein
LLPLFDLISIFKIFQYVFGLDEFYWEKMFWNFTGKGILNYIKKQRNKVNNMSKIAKENFENNLDYFLLENSSNLKTYWKIMKMLIKSNTGSNCISPIRNSINDENFDDIVYFEYPGKYSKL